MATSQFRYANGKWTGTVTFCGVTRDVELYCDAGNWIIKVHGNIVSGWGVSTQNINGTWTVVFDVYPDLTDSDLTDACGPEVHGVSFKIYIPLDFSACPE